MTFDIEQITALPAAANYNDLLEDIVKIDWKAHDIK